MDENGFRKDVIIQVPTAHAGAGALAPGALEPPSPEQVMSWQAARIRELEKESAERTLAASTLANVAGCMCRRLVELGYGDGDGIVIPRAVSEKLRGVQVMVSETTGGDVRVNARDQEVPAPLGWEDRRDG